METPKDLLFTKDHEWARIQGKTATIGITDYAQHSLGDITFVDLPRVGAVLKQAGSCATVESVKAASDVFAPLSGKVVSINEELGDHPELVNKTPYAEGYFFVMEISDETEKVNLMNAVQYSSYVEGLSSK